MPDPTLCRTGCGARDCAQGRLPCPHRAADVAAMREMGIDLQPPPVREPLQSACPESEWLTVDALLALGLVAAIAYFTVWS